MPDGLTGRVAIVTGAGGAVGGAIATRLLEAGAQVMLADDGEAQLAPMMKALEAHGSRVGRFHHRKHDKLGAANLMAATLDAFDRVDILVNTPRATEPGALAELDAASLSQALEQNVTSAFLLSQAVAKRIAQQPREDMPDGGAILNVSSIAAQRTVPELLAYSVSCAALDQLTRSMAADLAADRIRVNAIALGAVMTERMRELLRERSELRAELVQVTPLRRIGEAEEAAEAALFLCSPRASFITGQVLAVDGGRLVLDPLASPDR
ncbi:MAG: SDR family oxidoreductase [Pseudomonadota bacterium]